MLQRDDSTTTRASLVKAVPSPSSTRTGSAKSCLRIPASVPTNGDTTSRTTPECLGLSSGNQPIVRQPGREGAVRGHLGLPLGTIEGARPADGEHETCIPGAGCPFSICQRGQPNEGRPQRTMPLRERAQVQEVLLAVATGTRCFLAICAIARVFLGTSKKLTSEGEHKRPTAFAINGLTLLRPELQFLHPKVCCQIGHDIPLPFGHATHHWLKGRGRIHHS